MSGPDSFEIKVIEPDDLWSTYGKPLPASSTLPVESTARASPFYRPRQWPIWTAGGLLSLLLHGVLLGTLVLGYSGARYRPPMSEGPEVAFHNPNASEVVSTLILIKDHGIATAPPDDTDYTVPVFKDLQRLPAPDLATIAPVPQIEIAGTDDGTDQSISTAAATDTTAGRVMLFGRYLGQIKARIERAWVYPSDSKNQSFQCRVQIRQNHKGEVLEVTMTRCDNDPIWQLSLAKAIQAASPLSAPPNEQVFTEVITMAFNASAPSTQASNH